MTDEVKNDGLQQEAGEKAPKKVKLIKMERDGHAADVHPEEVDNMKAHNWVEVK